MSQPVTMARIAAAQKNNELFAINLRDGLGAMPKMVLGVAAATALDRAIRKTKHASSRAAANWDLSVGGAGMRESLSPRSYGETPAGERYDAGSNITTVLAYKAMYYGYGEPSGMSGNSSSVFLEPEKGARLYSALRIGEGGGVPSCYLFNPVMNVNNARLDGSGRSYAYNAFFGEEKGPPIDEIVQLVGNGYIPIMVKRINEQVRWATAYKKHWKPMFGRSV